LMVMPAQDTACTRRSSLSLSSCFLAGATQ
jgi:hypothetical protein